MKREKMYKFDVRKEGEKKKQCKTILSSSLKPCLLYLSLSTCIIELLGGSV